jgi:hypothetical protein
MCEALEAEEWSGRGVATGQGASPTDATPLALAHAPPDAELLAVGQCVFEAVLTHHAPPADLLGFPGGRTALREEEVWIDAEAVRPLLPTRLLRLQRFEQTLHASTPLMGTGAEWHRCNYMNVIIVRDRACVKWKVNER